MITVVLHFDEKSQAHFTITVVRHFDEKSQVHFPQRCLPFIDIGQDWCFKTLLPQWQIPACFYWKYTNTSCLGQITS